MIKMLYNLFMIKIKKIIKNYWHWLILVILAIIFFVGSGSYIYLSQKDNFIKWGSPDETANYTFAKLYAQENKISIFENYNLIANDLIHPRSFRSDNGELKPVSFLGIILIFGQLAKIISVKAMPYFTPLLAAIGLIFYYLLIKKIFGKNIGLISTLILSTFPVYIYYSSRSMFHNILFIVLFLIGLYFSLLMADSKEKNENKYFYYLNKFFFPALAGLLIGLAIIVRTSELLWLIPLFLFLWIFNIKKIGFVKLIIFLSFLFLGIIPCLFWNNVLYGSYFNFGYPELNRTLVSLADNSTGLIKISVQEKFLYYKDIFLKFVKNIFYFGFSADKSLKMAENYINNIFYWLFGPAVLGFIFYLLNIYKWKKRHYLYLFSLFFVSIILIFYYGSWEFYDNPNRNEYTIGNSYTRYWLPIYLGGIPFISMIILKISNFTKNKIFSSLISIILIAGLSAISLSYVLAGSSEGLINSYYRTKELKKDYNKVINLTKKNSVIITRYHDKIFFPERKVIVGQLDDENMINIYAKIAKYLPLYFYNFKYKDKDLPYLNDTILKKTGLKIREIEKINIDFSLYKLEY